MYIWLSSNVAWNTFQCVASFQRLMKTTTLRLGEQKHIAIAQKPKTISTLSAFNERNTRQQRVQR